MKRIRFTFAAIVALLTILVVGGAFAEPESKYATGTTSAAVTFGPSQGRPVIKHIHAVSDKLGAVCKIYAKGGVGKVKCTSAASASATHIPITNTGVGLTTNDPVVVVHATGNIEYRTLTGYNSATNVTLSSGLTYALTTSDYIYELAQGAEMLVGGFGTGAGTNDTFTATGEVYAGPGDSPLYVVVDGTNVSKINATVEK
jgi:hypothetical protein